MVHAMEKTQVGYASKYITVKGNNMHLALYGNWMQMVKNLQMKEKHIGDDAGTGSSITAYLLQTSGTIFR